MIGILRPYQQQALDNVLALYRLGRRRMLVVLPTGVGKSLIAAALPLAARMRKRMLVLAHREELLDQAARKFAQLAPEFSVGVEQGRRRAGHAQVVVASVPSLRGKRLQALDPDQFYLVACDEAHHAVAASYRTIFDHLGLMDPNSLKLLVGFTATPGRADRRALGEVFECVAFSRELPEMIREGWLCPVRGLRVDTGTDLSGVSVRQGDFAPGELNDAVNLYGRNRAVVAAYLDHAGGRKALVFCASVAHAQDLAQAFASAGVSSRAVWGDMPDADRAAALAGMASGETHVTTNVMVLTEGFDEPTIDCVILARPTKHLPLLAQMIGRGTRLSPGKADLLVIDIADVCRRHDLARLTDLFALPRALNLDGADALKVSEEIRELEEDFPGLDLDDVRLPGDIRVKLRSFDLVSVMDATRDETHSRFAWMPVGRDRYRLSVQRGAHLEVRQDEVGAWTASRWADGAMQVLGRAAALRDAVQVADAVVRFDYGDRAKILQAKAAWRRKPASEKQLETLARLRITAPDGVSRGHATLLIDRFLSTGRHGLETHPNQQD